MFVMLHHIGLEAYLGCIQINEVTVDADTLVKGWWDEFQQTHPDSDSLFIEFLSQHGYATEAEWNGDPNNTPIHCYIA